MDRLLSNPQLLAIIAVVLAAVIAAAMFVAVVAVAFFVLRRRRGPAAPDRAEVLADLGYVPTGKEWSRRFQGTSIVFSDAKGWRWTIRLPRYNTLTLQIEERSSGIVPPGRVFDVDDPAFDQRFVVSSELAAQAIALVTNRAVSAALLQMPFLSLRLHGDELVIGDPDRRGLGDAAPGSAAAMEAEREAHLGVSVLVNCLFDSLYSRATGTIMPEHR